MKTSQSQGEFSLPSFGKSITVILFSYAPWGNENDENASIVNISVGASSLSRPFVYYGDKKISFYEKIRPREWEDIDSDSDDQPSGQACC